MYSIEFYSSRGRGTLKTEEHSYHYGSYYMLHSGLPTAGLEQTSGVECVMCTTSACFQVMLVHSSCGFKSLQLLAWLVTIHIVQLQAAFQLPKTLASVQRV